MKCPKCGNEVNGKFCGKCGLAMPTSLTISDVDKSVCATCGTLLKTGTKFCGKCGKPVQKAAASVSTDAANADQIETSSGHLFWNIHPGQVAVKLQENLIEKYETARGVIIHEGTRALIYCGGQLVNELSSGTYDLLSDAEYKKVEADLNNREGGLVSAMGSGGRFLINLIFGTRKREKIEQDRAAQQKPTTEQLVAAAKSKKAFCIVLAREGEFPVILEFKKIPTSAIRVDIGLQITCAITDLKAFYASMLLDRSMLTTEALSELLMPVLETPLVGELRTCGPDEIDHNAGLQQRITAVFKTSLAIAFPFLVVARVNKVVARKEELERLRQLKEEMYLSEQELDQLSRRNEFMNRLRIAQNQQKLDEARSDVDFKREMQQINRDQLLSEDEMEKFTLLLQNEKRIRTAKTDDEYASALAGIKKSGLLRAEEIADMERSIRERGEDHELGRSHAINLMQIANNLATDKAILTWEYEVGDKRIEIELKRQRQKYEAEIGFADLQVQTQRKHDQYGDERRRSKIDLDKEEMTAQMDIARQAQTLTEQKRQAEHDREIAARAQTLSHEKEMELGKLDRFAGMTFEQIMAANPNMNTEAARALAEKFKAQAASATGDDRVRMAEQQKSELKDFMTQQMELMRDMVRSNADIAAGSISGKERELQRAHAEVDQTGQRMSQVVGTTVTAMGGQKSQKKCVKCGAMLATDAGFCTECGEKQ